MATMIDESSGVTQVWKTPDGRIFDHEHQAIAHKKECDIKEVLEEHRKELESLFDDKMRRDRSHPGLTPRYTNDAILEFMVKYSLDVTEIMLKIDSCMRQLRNMPPRQTEPRRKK